MRKITNYIPPSTEDLAKFKDELGFTGEQMAALVGVAGNSQWRKYTGGAAPRVMGPHLLFFTAAQLTLDDAEMERVFAKMHEIGAQFITTTTSE